MTTRSSCSHCHQMVSTTLSRCPGCGHNPHVARVECDCDRCQPRRLTAIRTFLLGVFEFRLDCTTHFDYPLIETYDLGRDWAHRLTFRHWDSCR